MRNIDLFRDAFKKFVADGMTPLEAYRQFDEKEWHEAVSAEIDLRGPDAELLDLGVAAMWERMDEKDMEQATVLWLAGWKSELPNGVETHVMSWYWRRPPRREGSKGMLFLSTNQAFMHLQRSKP